jgi:multidrug resistance efflux pump
VRIPHRAKHYRIFLGGNIATFSPQHAMSTHPPPLFSDANPFAAARKNDAGIGLGLPGTFVPDPPKPGQAVVPPAPAPAAAAPPPAAPTVQRNAWSATVTRPEPLPKQAKGQWFIASILVGMVAAMGIVLFQSFAYFAIQGVVEGRVIQLAAPWDGSTQAIYVREGDLVTAGQLLFTVENPVEQQQSARLSDELRIAQAELEAKGAELQLQASLRGDLSQKAQAEYFELWGTLLAEQARLSDLEAQKGRLQALRASGSASVAEWESRLAGIRGQTQKLEKLEIAVAAMKERTEINDSGTSSSAVVLKPKLVELEKIQAEMSRLRQRLEMGHIRSPVGGRVIRRHRFTGEPVKAGESILEVLEDDSLRVVVYLPQERGDHFKLGQRVAAYVAPQTTATECVVERLGEQLQPAPRSIDPNFPKSELRVPVYLRPIADADSSELRLGSKVRLPRQLSWTLGSASTPTDPAP